MTIRAIGKKRTLKRNSDILNMLLKYSVKEVAQRYCLSPMAIYQIAFRHKKQLEGRN